MYLKKMDKENSVNGVYDELGLEQETLKGWDIGLPNI